MTSIVHTEHSLYEIDQSLSRMRRLKSSHDPTPNQGEDGEWRNYWHLSEVDSRIVIEWGIDKTDAGPIIRRTLTSRVQVVAGDPLNLPAYKQPVTEGTETPS